ncbi:MAG: polyphosphate polymerase domain-containing protein [Nannocystaceae bacterium]
MAEADPRAIERREYKYLIAPDRVAPIRDALRPYCDLDPYAARLERGRYRIDNLYFDTDALSLYQRGERGRNERLKLRVRGYPGTSRERVFLEVKRRVDDLILKTRGEVSIHQWTELFRAPDAPLPADLVGRDRAAVERFITLARGLRVRPFTLVRYEREPHVSRIDDYVRVTFDSDIRAQLIERRAHAPAPRVWRAFDPIIVLELKFNGSMPPWLAELVTRFDLRRRPFSKYRSSIRAFYRAPPWLDDPSPSPARIEGPRRPRR